MPAAFVTNAAGHLEIDGCDVVDLVAEHGAPLWVISEATVRANYRRLRDAFQRVYPATSVLYATKANPEPAIIPVALAEGAMVDAVTLGHLRLIERAGGARPDRLQRQLEDRGGAAVGARPPDRHDQRGLARGDGADRGGLAGGRRRAAAAGVPARGRRRRPARGSRPGARSSEWLGKFGMDRTDLLAAAEIARSHPGIELAGLHNHLGYPGYGDTYTPALDLERHTLYVLETLEIARELHDLGDTLRVLNLGGGYRVGNPEGFGPGRQRAFPTADEYASAIAGTVARVCEEWSLGTPELILEAGGYLVSDAVALVGRVGLSKSRRSGADERRWAFLEDTSSYHFVRRLIYGFYHHAVIANRMEEPPAGPVSIAGPICADDDVVLDVALPAATAGRSGRGARQRLVLRGDHHRLLRRAHPCGRDGVGRPVGDHPAPRDRGRPGCPLRRARLALAHAGYPPRLPH